MPVISVAEEQYAVGEKSTQASAAREALQSPNVPGMSEQQQGSWVGGLSRNRVGRGSPFTFLLLFNPPTFFLSMPLPGISNEDFFPEKEGLP